MANLFAALLMCCGTAVAQTPQAVTPPADSPVSLTLGSVTVTTYNPVTMTPVENSTDLYFVAKNNGAQPVTLQFTSFAEIKSAQPDWVTHFFKFFGFESGGPTNIPLAAGETRTLKFYVSDDIGAVSRQAQLPFRFNVLETGNQGTLTITLIGDAAINDLRRVKSATISGRVTSASQQPIPGALISVSIINENLAQSVRTDTDGRYKIDVVSIDDVKTTMGGRTFPYNSIDYFLTAEADGYAMAYRGGLAPATSQTVVADVTLEPATQKAAFRLVGELPTDGTLSYWWIRFAGNGDRVVAVQGQHPVVPLAPQHIIAADLTGKELWRVVTGGQCWGFDVSPDGSLVAAGCDDGFVYIVSANGQLLRKVQTGFPNPSGQVPPVRDARFSPDAKYLVAEGGPASFSVLDVQTGQVVWKSPAAAPGEQSEGDYKSRWSRDGTRLVTSDPNGLLAMFTSDGTLLWRTNLGISQLWLEIDDAKNVYAAGKQRELISFDKDGNQRWSYRLAHTAMEAVNGITADGTFMLAPTFNGLLQAFDAQGRVSWQHFVPTPTAPPPEGSPLVFSQGTGHNALSMTPTGNLIAIGTRGYQALLYDRSGTLLWSHQATFRTDFHGPKPNYSGTTSIAMRSDGKFFAAGYADSTIRIFADHQPFTDDSLITGGSTIRAVHITELRARIDAQRIRFGLQAFAWTDASLSTGSTPVRAIHITELRTALQQAYSAGGFAVPVFTDPTLTVGGALIKVTHIQDLRVAVIALEAR